MEKFSCFKTKTEIINGRGSIEYVVKIVKNKKVMIITDPFIAEINLCKQLEEMLKNNHIKYKIFKKVESQPSIEIVEEALKLLKKDFKVDFIIAIGGGSSIDTAKAVNMRYSDPSNGIPDFVGKMWEFSKSPIPIIAIPTTAGTGSDMTSVAVITDKETNQKMAIKSEQIVPRYTILDPNMLKTVPSSIAAVTGIDALVHAVEAFLSNKSTPITDAISTAAIEMISKNLRKFIADTSKNYIAAEKMQIASTLAGWAFSNAGLGLTHALALPLGVKYHLSHGLACAICFLPVLKYNYIAKQEKYCKIAEIIEPDCIDYPFRKKGLYAIDLIKILMDDIGVPYTLSSIGKKMEYEEELTNDAFKLAPVKVNPRKVNREDIVSLFKQIK
jgi:alcohol dehydrogenase